MEVGEPFEILADLVLWSLVRSYRTLLLILGKVTWAPMVEVWRKHESTAIAPAHGRTKLAQAQFKAEMDQAFAKFPR